MLKKGFERLITPAKQSGGGRNKNHRKTLSSEGNVYSMMMCSEHFVYLLWQEGLLGRGKETEYQRQQHKESTNLGEGC